MFKQLQPAAMMLAIFTVLTGVVYPALVTGVSQVLFPHQANGSLISDNSGKTWGSELIGQAFTKPEYFWARPSATGPFPNNAAASSGSNLGPTNPALAEAVKARIEALKSADPGNTSPIPIDLLTASGSGLDPQISLAAAHYQIQRVAKVRNVPADKIRALVDTYTEARQWGFLGEPRVNVLALNLTLDAMH